MEELECDNEAQLSCKILPSLSTLLSNESLSRLKSETIRLAERHIVMKKKNQVIVNGRFNDSKQDENKDENKDENSDEN